METFKVANEVSLKANEVEIMQDVYEDIKVLSHGQVPLVLDVSCPSCIRDVFHIFISVFDRYTADPDVAGDHFVAPINDDEIDPSTDTGFKLTKDEDQIITDLFKKYIKKAEDEGKQFDVPSPEDVAEFKERANVIIDNESHRPEFRQHLRDKIVEMDNLLQVMKDNENFGALEKVFNDRLATLVELGAISRPEDEGITAGDSYISYDDIKNGDAEDWEETMELVKMGVWSAKQKAQKDEQAKSAQGVEGTNGIPEQVNQVPSANPAPAKELTPAQKGAATKAAKKLAEQKGN